jgi:hypothetical protein
LNVEVLDIVLTISAKLESEMKRLCPSLNEILGERQRLANDSPDGVADKLGRTVCDLGELRIGD